MKYNNQTGKYDFEEGDLNVVCPGCGKPINAYDFAAGACNDCRISFAIEFYKINGKVGIFCDEKLSQFKFI